jgi:hypothetical protein
VVGSNRDHSLTGLNPGDGENRQVFEYSRFDYEVLFTIRPAGVPGSSDQTTRSSLRLPAAIGGSLVVAPSALTRYLSSRIQSCY